MKKCLLVILALGALVVAPACCWRTSCPKPCVKRCKPMPKPCAKPCPRRETCKPKCARNDVHHIESNHNMMMSDEGFEG